MRLKAFALAAFATLVASGAQADSLTLRVLLDSGFKIVGTSAVIEDITQRALNDKSVSDELLIVLQRDDEIAFCHVIYAATFNNDSVRDVPCFRPAGAAPTTDTASSEAPQASAASSVPPPAPAAAPPPPAASSAQ